MNSFASDIGSIFGLGFPPFRGGPFTHTDHVGAATIVGQLEALVADHRDRNQPARILRDHATDKPKFRS